MSDQADKTPAAPSSFEAAMAHLREVVASRRGASPDESYVAKLLDRGVDLIGKKIGEEATEVVIAAKNANHNEIIWEVADLLFHTVVLLESTGVTLDEVGGELLRRAR
jgi:phosphoribosyl-ATP pyrophosphohydrolase